LITCGPDEIDGYAFSLGVESWRVFPSIRRVLQDFIFPVTYLIREAIFRPRNSLGTCSLGGLLDMYHTDKATKCHDKVYALLGMSSDDLSNAGLSPNYMIIWEELMQRLLKHIISDMIAVEVARNKQATVIRSSGHTLGTVQEVEDDPIRGDRLCLQVSKSSIGHDMAWTVQATAKRVRPGDIICCLQGASQPTIVRVRKDYFMVVAIAVEILEMKKTYQHSGELEGGPDRNFLLVWDWEESPQMSQDLEWYNMWKKTGDWKMGGQTLEEEDHLARARRTWNVALILNDITRVSLNSGLETRKEEAGRRAVADCDMVVRHKGSHQSGVRSSAVSQPWAVDIYGDGNNAVLELLLPEVSLNTDFDRYPTGYLQPLRWAALGEHEGVLELLFNSMHEPPKGLLLQAAEYGHKALVRLLLKTGKVDVDMKDHLGRTPLFWAAKCGHQDVVQLLLKTGKVDVSTKDEKGCTLLYKAAERGHKAIVRLLLKTGKVDVDTKDKWGCTPLFRAAERGHQDVVRILLKTGKVDVDTKDRWGHTLLYKAAERGHTVIVRSLLKTGKVDVDTKDEQGRTPLWKAAEHGHKAIVQLLLKTGTADVDMKDKEGLTPLWTAAEHEHEDIVRLLLKTGKVEVDIKDEEGWTPLLVAVAYGREDMVKLVLETGKVIPEMDHIHGETMLSHALQVLEQGGPPTDQEWQNWLDYSAEWKTEAWDKKYRNIVKMLREAAKGK
jgi:ankyrin repeat protein